MVEIRISEWSEFQLPNFGSKDNLAYFAKGEGTFGFWSNVLKNDVGDAVLFRGEHAQASDPQWKGGHEPWGCDGWALQPGSLCSEPSVSKKQLLEAVGY